MQEVFHLRWQALHCLSTGHTLRSYKVIPKDAHTDLQHWNGIIPFQIEGLRNGSDVYIYYLPR